MPENHRKYLEYSTDSFLEWAESVGGTHDKRKSTKLQKIIHDAGFCYPNACVEDIKYHADRNLDKPQMLEFSTCRYIADSHHIILKGASGNGKLTLLVP
ncbi:hypothetical protein bsdcttw_45110 [Anaerocolumna chitinilytica]|uniref:IstB-like ATP-binding domain-containing protein n=1 Tax=Anaerocolumna chitinilytica TaxID=1727145 RepID=A0A7M3SA53_9FIRM|nr:ATP-binding protein [Anaerocolumna chitinilytica]BCK01471.1 hypothetical protein bsdcttw_45110 [Anaerocolumna chitinilytica]